MNLLALALVVAVVAVGYGLTRLLDVDLIVEERVLYGLVVGTMAVSVIAFGLAWVVGLNRGAVAASAVIGLGLSAPGWRRAVAGRGPVEEWRDVVARARRPLADPCSPWPVTAIVAVSAVVSARVLSLAYGTTADGGISAGHLSTFGDWSAHLAYTASFAHADNFPPELPTAAGHPFAYHFGVDFFAALFVPLGLSVPDALVVTTGLLAAAVPGVLYLTAHRLLADRLASLIGVVVFLAAGGTAALHRFLLVDLPERGPGVLVDLPRSYANDGFDRNWVDNPVTGFLYPQRPTLIGFAAVVIGLALLWTARGSSGARVHVGVGLLTGLLPVFNVFAFAVLVVMGAAWAVIERARRWWWFGLPALGLGLPVVAWQALAADSADSGRFWHTGWMLGLSSWERTVPDLLWFWLLNTGVFIPLVTLGLWRRRELALRFLPIFGLLLIANAGIWHHWPGNNAKYVVFFLLLGAPFVGAVVADLIRRPAVARVGAGLVLVTLTLSGGLDIWRAFEGSSGPYPAAYLSGDDVLVGQWVVDHTEHDAVFATANDHVHPIRVVAGRTVVSGSAARLQDLGVDAAERDADLRALYRSDPTSDEAVAVIDRYAIDYVVVGPQERRAFGVDRWASAPVVYDLGGYTIHRVPDENVEARRR